MQSSACDAEDTDLLRGRTLRFGTRLGAHVGPFREGGGAGGTRAVDDVAGVLSRYSHAEEVRTGGKGDK